MVLRARGAALKPVPKGIKRLWYGGAGRLGGKRPPSRFFGGLCQDRLSPSSSLKPLDVRAASRLCLYRKTRARASTPSALKKSRDAQGRFPQIRLDISSLCLESVARRVEHCKPQRAQSLPRSCDARRAWKLRWKKERCCQRPRFLCNNSFGSPFKLLAAGAGQGCSAMHKHHALYFTMRCRLSTCTGCGFLPIYLHYSQHLMLFERLML